MKRPPIHGLMAEFEDVQQLIEAARRTREAGYRHYDAYTPIPVEELAEVMHAHDNRLSWLVLVGGILGLVGGYGLQYWTSVIDYPINIGGRPLHSWPAFIPPAFETTILGAALFCVLGMLALNGLPMPYHPVFNVPEFARASSDRFFLAIEARDPVAKEHPPREFLESAGAERTWILEG